ncbi:hypothetical protein CYMTET_23382 [Cymbomonas tetramitiformis]|uniref:Uncharacterized protein n=1 Tax=Cymbomonas tetramitiformis TaxID=36881 RepID=A0AAE0FYF3_9CHLO|nr:hypothetical protein CYMTET_23382 [Cymbomonas tetramitiformis]
MRREHALKKIEFMPPEWPTLCFVAAFLLLCNSAPSIWAKHPESFRRASGELPESFRKDGPVIDHTPSPRVAGPCSAVGTCLRQTALKPELTALRGLHAYGKQPMRELETHRFPVLVHAMPQLAADECDSEELPAGHEASDKDWRVQVHTLCIRVAEFQACVKSHRPALPISDVMRDESFKRRTRSVHFEDDEEETAREATRGWQLGVVAVFGRS